jgi:hypothetical protein
MGCFNLYVMINIIAATIIITAKSWTMKLDGESSDDKPGFWKNGGNDEESVPGIDV